VNSPFITTLNGIRVNDNHLCLDCLSPICSFSLSTIDPDLSEMNRSGSIV
jgi:hypothetical protein